MKAINVTELKANLSKYLRMASRGTRIVVTDRDEPIAQLGPLPEGRDSGHARLAQAGRLRPGTGLGTPEDLAGRATDRRPGLASRRRQDPDEVSRR